MLLGYAPRWAAVKRVAFVGTQGIGDAAHVAEIAHALAGGQAAGDLDDGFLSHAVNQQIGLGVEQNGSADRVAPIVVVG